MRNKENAGDRSSKKGPVTRSATKKAQSQRDPLTAKNAPSDVPSKAVRELFETSPERETVQPTLPGVPPVELFPTEFSFKTPGKSKRPSENEEPTEDPETPKVSGKPKAPRAKPASDPKPAAKSALRFSSSAVTSPPKVPNAPAVPETPPSSPKPTSPPAEEGPLPAKSPTQEAPPSKEAFPTKPAEAYAHPLPPRTPPRTAPGLMGRPGFLASPGYNCYPMPMYPPYTPTPAYFDPSGQFSHPSSPFFDHRSQAGSMYSGSGIHGPLFADPLSPNCSYPPSFASPTHSRASFVPPFEQHHMQEMYGMPHGREAWRMHMGNPYGQTLGEAANHTPSVRQMTSMCFQAASKGSLARLPRGAVRTLVQHQLQSQEPLHAPWYRRAAGKSSPDAEKGEKANGTGVWLPKSAEP